VFGYGGGVIPRFTELKDENDNPLFPDAAERMQLAVAYLKGKGYQRIALVSHSNGSRMSRVYMATNPSEVGAWVALSLTRGDTFAGIKVPVLDLYGANDLPHVLAATAQRKASFANTASRQIVLAHTNHFFARQEEAMVKAVKDFLNGLK
jgi:pimeloyl-ACP methyl ester carboxylesterase